MVKPLTHYICEACQNVVEAKEPQIVDSPVSTWEALRSLRLGRAKQEKLVGVFLSTRKTILGIEVISVGGLNTTRTHPREILQPAIGLAAQGFILAHNHPSGTLEPSEDDLLFTRAVKKAAAIVGIPLYDHLIISSKGYVSLRQRDTAAGVRWEVAA